MHARTLSLRLLAVSIALLLPSGAGAQTATTQDTTEQGTTEQGTITSPVTDTTTTTSATTGSTMRVDAHGNPVTITSHRPVPPPRDHRAAFEAMDSDDDGRVDRSEAAGDKYLLRAFGELDTDGSGELDYEEMLAWLDD